VTPLQRDRPQRKIALYRTSSSVIVNFRNAMID